MPARTVASLNTAVCLSTDVRCMQHTRNKNALESGIVPAEIFPRQGTYIRHAQQIVRVLIMYVEGRGLIS